MKNKSLKFVLVLLGWALLLAGCQSTNTSDNQTSIPNPPVTSIGTPAGSPGPGNPLGLGNGGNTDVGH
jgi:hypothetical protein